MSLPVACVPAVTRPMPRPQPARPTPTPASGPGAAVARRFVSPDGLIVLVGKTAEDNDVLSLKLGAPHDFWLHVAAESGSHVVVRNPDRLTALPRETAQFAAGLAAGYSKARRGGRVAVHLAHLRRRQQAARPRAGQGPAARATRRCTRAAAWTHGGRRVGAAR